MSDTPLYDALERYEQSKPSRLHMPGHKGSAPLGWLNPVLPYDVTELSFSDNLFSANGVILESEKMAAKAFGAPQTCLCAGGATLAIFAMLATCPTGSKILVGRRCHRSVLHAMALLDLRPEWVYSEAAEQKEGLPKPPGVKSFDRALKNCPDATGAVVTSPDYYGQLTHPLALCKWARERTIKLFWDNSHGTHLAFMEGDLHPARHAPAMVVDSAHKTLPVLTGGAFVHFSLSFEKSQIKQNMALMGSSSPSYLILASLDKARALMVRDETRKKLKETAEKIAFVKSALSKETPFSCLEGEDTDPLRLTVSLKDTDKTGHELSRSLEKAGIFAEMADLEHVVFLGSGFETEGAWEGVLEALVAQGLKTSVAQVGGRACEGLFSLRPKVELTPREAMLSKCKKVALSQAAGKIAARPLTPYPPGIPVIMPGERIDSDTARVLALYFQEVEIL